MILANVPAPSLTQCCHSHSVCLLLKRGTITRWQVGWVWHHVTWIAVRAMPIRIHVWSAAHDPYLFATYRLLPFLTYLDWSGVRICHGQVKRPSGDAYLKSCHNLFFWGRIQTPVFSDRPFFLLRVICFLACRAQSNFFSCDTIFCLACRAQSNFFGRIRTPAVCDRPFWFLRVCVSGALE